MNTNSIKLQALLCGIIFLISMSVASTVSGQARYFDERYITTQGYVNPVLFNPGAIGQSGYHQILINYRNKWASFDDSPKSFIGSYDGSVGNNIGIGAMIVSDNNAALETLKGQLGVNYTIKSANNKIGVGLTTEFIGHNIDAGVINDETVDASDVLILNRLDGRNFFDISLGAHGVYDDKFIYGVTLPGLLSTMLDDTESTVENEFGYILHLGYRFKVESYDIIAEPSIIVKSLRYVPLHVDINLMGRFLDEKLSGGVTYTVGADERLGFLIGARVNAFNFFYSYNVSRHQFQTYNNGSHELSVRFDLGRKDKVMTTDVMGDKMMDK